MMEAHEPSARYLADLQPVVLQQFDLLATAPEGIARLRALILALAVSGKLTAQKAGDESAETLLQRIRDQRGHRGIESVSEEEKGHKLPRGWQWARLSDLGRIVGGGTPKSDVPDYWTADGVAWLTPADLYGHREKFVRRGRRDISVKGLDESSAQLMPAGTVLFSSRAPIGYVAIAAAPLATNQGFKSCVPFVEGISEYLYWHLKHLAPDIDAGASGTTFKEISGKEFGSLVVALPPLAEQARIVARVDELMHLCDALEAKGRLEAEQHARLLSTLLGTLTDSRSPEELAANWQRVAAHFDLLLDRPEAVDALEHAILDLAVRGNLLKADLDHESAGPAFEQGEDAISDGELPHPIPGHWRWVRLGSVAELINGDRGSNYPNKSEYVQTGLPFINTGHIEPDGTLSRESMNYLTQKKFDSLRSGKTRPGDLVYCLRGATLGKTAIVDLPEGAVASSLVIIRLAQEVDRKFAYYYLTGPLGRSMVKRFDNGSAQPNLAASSVKRYVLPLPPLSEQHRIVARVAQLRRLCADLRQRLAVSRATQARLADALTEAVAGLVS
jgi:type I restriction enzyme S subunit